MSIRLTDSKNCKGVHFTLDDTDHIWMNCSNCINSQIDTTKTYLKLMDDYRLTCSLCNNKNRLPIFTNNFNPHMKFLQTDDHTIDNKHFRIHWFIDDDFIYLHCDKCQNPVKLRVYHKLILGTRDTPNNLHTKIILEATCGCKGETEWNRYRSLMHSHTFEANINYDWQQIGM